MAFVSNHKGVRLASGFVLLVICVKGLHAASFDCAKAQRPVEKVICGDPKLNTSDESLGRIYRATLAKLPAAAVAEVRDDQVQWLAWAQEICKADDANQPAAVIAKCMTPLYEARMKLLRTAVVNKGGVLFMARTQYIAAPEPQAETMGAPEFPGYGTLQASWPEAVSTDKNWAAWNRAVAARAFLASGDADSAKKAGPAAEPRWTPELAAGADSETTLKVRSVEHGRVTTSVSMNMMGHGAAHPNEAFSTMTWLLDQERDLRADDVFAANSGWQAKLAEICWGEILKQGADNVYPEAKGSGAKALLDDVADVSNWTLKADGLHISYPEYSI